MFKRLFASKKPCRICGKTDTERLFDGADQQAEAASYCRQHLVEALRDAFTAYEGNIVVTDPNERENYNKHYPFYPLESMGDFDFPEDDVQSVTLFLRSADERTCQECGGKAGVVYFARETLPPSAAEAPDDYYGEVITSGIAGTYYCKQHGFELIAPKILNHSQPFSKGVVKPYGQEGLYLATYI